MRRKNGASGAELPNPYAFVGNNAISRSDENGLRIWVCTIRTSGFPLYGLGTHAYFWDDRKGTDWAIRECGTESSSGSGSMGNTSENYGPVDTGTNAIPVPWRGNGKKGMAECYPVDDSAGKEDAVMKCCRAKANQGPFIPYAHDCHDALDRCLKEHKLPVPPHSRGDPISNHAKDIECACRE
jgi:hypothetical protein